MCDGKTTALCSTGGAPTNVGGTGNTDVGGNNSTGGLTSTSTTVLRIIGNQIRDLSIPNTLPHIPSDGDSGTDAGMEEDGMPVILRGVNRSGTEYQCVKGYSIFDGPDSEDSVKTIASWKVNAVRIPLNESCWLDINFDANTVSNRFAGAPYKAAIQKYVSLLHRYNIYPILELHWVAPGTSLATGQLPMPDQDHAADFWSDVTTTFKDDLGVVFELYNEPYPDNNRDTDAAWQCWKNGCTTNIVQWNLVNGSYVSQILGSYQSAGFQHLVDTVRTAEGVNTAASHVILLGGIQYSNRLTQWTKYKPSDPANNLGAAWHIYNNNGCAATTCFDGVPATLAKSTAIVATEIGQNDCKGNIVADWMNWFDSHNLGYLAWSWNAYGSCTPATNGSNGSPWSLVTDYASGTPNSEFATTFRDHLAALAK
jgi:endoglucanase